MGYIRGVDPAEALQPVSDKFLCKRRLLELFQSDLAFQLGFFRFQRFQPFLGGFRDHAHLDGFQEIVYAVLGFLQPCFQKRHFLAFLRLHFHDAGYHSVNDLIVLQELYSFVDDQILQPRLLGRFQITLRPLLFGRCTFVVVVGFPVSPRTALTADRRPAVSAEQLC